MKPNDLSDVKTCCSPWVSAFFMGFQICGGFWSSGAPPRSLKWQRGLQQCRCCRPSAPSGTKMHREAPPTSSMASPVWSSWISSREKQAAGTSRLHDGSFSRRFPVFNPGIVREHEGAPAVLPPGFPAIQNSRCCRFSARVLRDPDQHEGTEQSLSFYILAG